MKTDTAEGPVQIMSSEEALKRYLENRDLMMLRNYFFNVDREVREELKEERESLKNQSIGSTALKGTTKL